MPMSSSPPPPPPPPTTPTTAHGWQLPITSCTRATLKTRLMLCEVHYSLLWPSFEDFVAQNGCVISIDSWRGSHCHLAHWNIHYVGHSNLDQNKNSSVFFAAIEKMSKASFRQTSTLCSTNDSFYSWNDFGQYECVLIHNAELTAPRSEFSDLSPDKTRTLFWWQHCVLRCCSLVAKRGNIVVCHTPTRNVSEVFENIHVCCVQDTKFVSTTNVVCMAKWVNILETWSS